MQSLFQASAQVVIAHQQEMVVVFEEVLPRRGPELELISRQNARSAGESVEIASIRAPFSYPEVGKGLGLGHEDDIEGTVICAEVRFPFNGAAQNVAVCHLKNASQLCWEHAPDSKTVSLQSYCQVHGVGVRRIAC